jgi:hypothetical protein
MISFSLLLSSGSSGSPGVSPAQIAAFSLRPRGGPPRGQAPVERALVGQASVPAILMYVRVGTAHHFP